MTVIAGRTQIHLGWPAAGAIVLFLIGTTWEAAMLFSSFMNGQHDLQRQLSAISRRDSIYFSKIDDQAQQIAAIKQHQYHLDSLLAISTPGSVSFHTEKTMNGQVHLEPNK